MRIIFLEIISGLITHNLARADVACFGVQGMTCATCPITVKAAVKRLNGISSVTTSLKENSAVVDYDSKRTKVNDIVKVIGDAGYKESQRDCKTKS